MQISWFEIVAQIINFFIILFILQKLLYKPVMNAMEKRQERIQEAQIAAEEKMNEADKLVDEYDEKIAGVDEEKREILNDAKEEAQERRNNLLEEYKEEAENKREAYLNEIEDEKENFINNLRKNLGKNAVKIASHILDTISSKELEEEVFHSFISNLKDLRKNISSDDSLKEEEHVELYYARELSDEEKEEIENTLKTQIGALKNINYKRDEDLILGYELELETYSVHTSIKNYLDEIERDIIEEIETN